MLRVISWLALIIPIGVIGWALAPFNADILYYARVAWIAVIVSAIYLSGVRYYLANYKAQRSGWFYSAVMLQVYIIGSLLIGATIRSFYPLTPNWQLANSIFQIVLVAWLIFSYTSMKCVNSLEEVAHGKLVAKQSYIDNIKNSIELIHQKHLNDDLLPDIVFIKNNIASLVVSSDKYDNKLLELQFILSKAYQATDKLECNKKLLEAKNIVLNFYN